MQKRGKEIHPSENELILEDIPKENLESEDSSFEIPKQNIDEELKSVFKEDDGKIIFVKKNYQWIWTCFVIMPKSWKNGMYIVRKVMPQMSELESEAKEQEMYLRIYECLLFDFKRCPSWRELYKKYYSDIADFEALENSLLQFSEEEQDELFECLKFGLKSDTYKEKPFEYDLPKNKIQHDWDA